jgi:hypothetical protein
MCAEQYPVILYGVFNVVQHSIFMIQFWMYGDGQKSGYLAWLLFPVVPLVMGLSFPQTITITNGIKPLTQILSHLPQLMECARLRTTSGVSLLSQHLNALGGFMGLYMLSIHPPINATTYLLYINSCFQALSVYALAMAYGEFNLIKSFTAGMKGTKETLV